MFVNLKKYILLSVLIISIIISDTKIYANEDLMLNALSAVLYDGDAGRVLYGKNENQVMPMASTTKIMTLVIALEYGNLDDVVTFSKYAAMQPDVQMNAKVGEQYYLKDLLYVMMLQSYNDVAVAVAEYVSDVYTDDIQAAEIVKSRKTEESKDKIKIFAGLMNAKAKELECYDTYFITPNGLDSEDENGFHSSTAENMAKIAAYAIKIPQVEEICTTRNYSFSEINGIRNVSISTTNRFLDMQDGAVGMKTGFTNAAGYCYVGAVKKDGKLLISVVLGCGWPPNKSYKWTDTKALMNYGINNYFYQKIFVPTDFYKKISVKDGIEPYVDTYIPFSLDMIISEKEEIKVTYSIREELDAPIEKNEEVGMVYIYIDSELFRVFPILTKNKVIQKDYLWYFKAFFEEILF